jgi:hypothetical protein
MDASKQVFAKLQTDLRNVIYHRLLCDAPNRIKSPEIRSHPFFRGIDWENIRKQRAPFVPQLTSITDTSYFPTEDLAGVPDQMHVDDGHGAPMSGGDDGVFSSLAFLGYTYRRWDTNRDSL